MELAMQRWPIRELGDAKRNALAEDVRRQTSATYVGMLESYLERGWIQGRNFLTGARIDPSIPLKRQSPEWAVLEPEEVAKAVALLRGNSTSAPTSTPTGAVSDNAGPRKPVPRSVAHEFEILSKLIELTFDPLKLPPAPLGKASPAKAQAREATGQTRAVFDKAWQRLRSSGQIKEAE